MPERVLEKKVTPDTRQGRKALAPGRGYHQGACRAGKGRPGPQNRETAEVQWRQVPRTHIRGRAVLAQGQPVREEAPISALAGATEWTHGFCCSRTKRAKGKAQGQRWSQRGLTACCSGLVQGNTRCAPGGGQQPGDTPSDGDSPDEGRKPGGTQAPPKPLREIGQEQPQSPFSSRSRHCKCFFTANLSAHWAPVLFIPCLIL